MGRSVRLHGPRNWQQSSQKAPTINRKGQKNYDNNNPFLSSEITTHSLLHFGSFGNKNNKLSFSISQHFLLFSFKRLTIMVLFLNSPLRENG